MDAMSVPSKGGGSTRNLPIPNFDTADIDYQPHFPALLRFIFDTKDSL